MGGSRILSVVSFWSLNNKIFLFDSQTKFFVSF